MAEDFSKSRAAPPAGPRAYEPPPAGWRPGKPNSPLTGERPDSRGQAPPRPYPAGAGGLPLPHPFPGLPLTHLMQHWVPTPVSRAGLYQLPGAPGGIPVAEELLQQQLERDQRLLAQHRQQQAQQQQPPPISR
ncbi:hypothetical protein FJT64_001713 [Amphibalanus amphitrite]|uniref:Uncharacterized protein n=1 Tax=Amphibalanus amphitrite TaxID=1232801 RepID=A0A6A4X093_AMPAM|nr:hypothetical protein FJT64_001713 [Amphibalanus amphitrite]